jgi:hypothetical protein
MKLKTNKPLTKELGVKMKNQRNKEWIGKKKNNIWQILI